MLFLELFECLGSSLKRLLVYSNRDISAHAITVKCLIGLLTGLGVLSDVYQQNEVRLNDLG